MQCLRKSFNELSKILTTSDKNTRGQCWICIGFLGWSWGGCSCGRGLVNICRIREERKTTSLTHMYCVSSLYRSYLERLVQLISYYSIPSYVIYMPNARMSRGIVEILLTFLRISWRPNYISKWRFKLRTLFKTIHYAFTDDTALKPYHRPTGSIIAPSHVNAKRFKLLEVEFAERFVPADI